MRKEVPPVRPDPAVGLTDAEVAERVAAGLTNSYEDPNSRSLADIIRSNTLTPFNALLGSLWIVMIIVAPLPDTMFGWVIVANTGIGIIQEYRASRALSKLKVIGEAKPRVMRNGQVVDVSTRDLVRDDVIELSAGDQVVVDGVVLSAVGLEMDESLLTGEADAVHKTPDEELMSGSFVAAGSGSMVATKVGAESFAAGITAEAKEYTLADSELRDSVMKFIRYVTILLIPIGALLTWSQLTADQSWRDAIRSSIAGVITMIPEGLVLLTSIAMAVAVIRLARRQALVQEMPAVEGLARTDIVCVDKTGTLTDPGMSLRAVVPVLAGTEESARAALGALATADPRPNPTMDAIRDDCPDPGWTLVGEVPFSSARKWSSASYADGSHWIIGAPEVLRPDWQEYSWGDRVAAEAAQGARVLLLTSAQVAPDASQPLPAMTDVAVVVIDQQLRSDAKETVRFFRDQDVKVVVISGDNPASVGAIAARAGIPGAESPVDARELGDESTMAAVLESASVFGRVTPAQKRMMVDVYQANGHTVTMTGDGVNDVLALKRADLGIAMGSGAPATRAVAQVVLLDNRWATLPQIVFEGRRVLGNIERVSDVFLTKSVYATVVALATGVFGVAFPFLPRHLTLIGALAIGIPGFFLALMPNTERFRPGFFKRVMSFAVPAGFVAAASAFTTYLVATHFTDEDSARTDATIALFVVSLAVLAQSARPLNPLRLLVVATMGGCFFLVLVIPPLSEFFAMTVHPDTGGLLGLAIGAAGAVVILAITPLIDRWRRSG
ncbi:MAG: HAD-IC family P-type ATPase [Actinobacteria bacterium]|nr:HAD-IC family P-type ATPase [Actinomycetota bacterium]